MQTVSRLSRFSPNLLIFSSLCSGYSSPEDQHVQTQCPKRKLQIITRNHTKIRMILRTIVTQVMTIPNRRSQYNVIRNGYIKKTKGQKYVSRPLCFILKGRDRKLPHSCRWCCGVGAVGSFELVLETDGQDRAAADR